jgi:hypothetical protein
MKVSQIIKALRCTCTADRVSDCGDCPYYIDEPIPEQLQAAAGAEVWPSCDVDRIGLNAADALEHMAARLGLDIVEEAAQ